MPNVTEDTIAVAVIDTEGMLLRVTGCEWHIYAVKLWMETWNAELEKRESQKQLESQKQHDSPTQHDSPIQQAYSMLSDLLEQRWSQKAIEIMETLERTVDEDDDDNAMRDFWGDDENSVYCCTNESGNSTGCMSEGFKSILEDMCAAELKINLKEVKEKWEAEKKKEWLENNPFLAVFAAYRGGCIFDS
ncbi:hypothetical protein K491DRAFT_746639 [Lophiostoma macrostomum CBS 122681]|uniref:Uncharacterized protein n=1 Tax=Lophiostoma macrostomum CBS 122681 TaxID=1314788 RepID=A0A6A6TS67_9PLEO|nr:hypothetical protein K491DRAFT_746639 [Lophiostoma macrostomum CBS 122681]